MSKKPGVGRHMRTRQRGYVLLTMGASAVVLFGVLGMAVDIGRMFIGKSEVQAFSDSAALAAALDLDGTTTGITAAKAAVAANANQWNFDTTKVASYTVDFAKTSSGPWDTSPNPAAGYIYVRVWATAPVGLYFIRVVVSQATQNVNSLSISGQIAQTSLGQGLGPYTAVGPDPSDTKNFGLVPGNQYDIRWPDYSLNKGSCDQQHPDKCFNASLCSGDDISPRTAAWEVAQQWQSSSIKGFWGNTNSNNVLDQEVLDAIQLQAVAPGSDVTMTSGNKQSEGTALNTRVSEDGDITDNTPSTYLANTAHNGRRMFALPIVTPTQVSNVAEGYVLGYGNFLLLSDGNNPSTFYKGVGNGAFCAVYMGGYVQAGTGPGGGNAGYYKVKLIQ